MNLFELLELMSILSECEEQEAEKEETVKREAEEPDEKVMTFEELIGLLNSGEGSNEKEKETKEQNPKNKEEAVNFMDFLENLLDQIPDNMSIGELIDHMEYSEENRTTDVFFKDGAHETVKASASDSFDPELGVMYCIMQYMTGGKQYLNDIRKLIRDYDKKMRDEELRQIAKEEEARRHQKKIDRKKAQKARRQREYDISVMKEAILRLKEEGLM